MSLLDLQRDMMAWLRTGDAHPAGPFGAGPGQDIYRNNHRASLMASLASSFAQLRRWMGEEAFDGAAAHHVDRVDPTDWTLDRYGADFPVTLATLHPDDVELPELGRLEWALEQAFVAADVGTLRIADLQTIDWDRAALELTATGTLQTITTNADAILLSLLNDGEPPAVTYGMDATVLVWRSGFTPCFRRLETEEAMLMEAMRPGVRFAQICEDLAVRHGAEQAVERAGLYLSTWAADGVCAQPRS